MNASMGWALAVALLVGGWFSYGWQGLLMAVSITVFWLLLQFSRAMRVMRKAAGQPVGRLGSAVMLQSRLVKGMTMMQVVGMTGSLGRRVDASGAASASDVWQWQDDGGVCLTLHFGQGKLTRWELDRPAGEVEAVDASSATAAGTAVVAAVERSGGP